MVPPVVMTLTMGLPEALLAGTMEREKGVHKGEEAKKQNDFFIFSLQYSIEASILTLNVKWSRFLGLRRIAELWISGY